MALKGHGDPRWIVENRPDGTNVNNWHWTETDYSNWSKQKLTEMLSGLAIETSEIACKTGTVTCSGDVSVNTRKQKTILFYELDVSIKWEGTLVSTGSAGKGTVHLPYISEENDDTDFEIKVSVDGDTNDQEKLKDRFRSQIIPILKEKIPSFLQQLREVALGQTKLKLKQAPTTKLDHLEQTLAEKAAAAEAEKKAAKTTTATSSKSAGPRLTNVSVTDKFVCRPMDVFVCFVEPNRVKAYAGGDAQISGEKGGKFSLFGGAVTGENVEIDMPNKLVQKWRFSSWPEGHYSTVTLEFEEKNGKTIVKLTQTDVPDDDKERAETGWKDNFFKRIKGIFGLGPLV